MAIDACSLWFSAVSKLRHFQGMGASHFPTSAIGTAWERTRCQATQRAALGGRSGAQWAKVRDGHYAIGIPGARSERVPEHEAVGMKMNDLLLAPWHSHHQLCRRYGFVARVAGTPCPGPPETPVVVAMVPPAGHVR